MTKLITIMKIYLSVLLCFLTYCSLLGQDKGIVGNSASFKSADTPPAECNYFTETFVTLKVALEGAYNEGTGLMRTDLNALNILPQTQPYNTTPYHYSGSESVTSFPANVVDWVLIEARRETAEADDIVKTQAALLLDDGQIVGLDGVSPLVFNLENLAKYFFCVRHRNHLDIVTATAISVTPTVSYDFTMDASMALGNSQLKTLDDGKVVMYIGDITQDGIIQVTDFDAWKINPAQVNVYREADLTMDGVVQVTDSDAWLLNKAKVGIPEIRF